MGLLATLLKLLIITAFFSFVGFFVVKAAVSSALDDFVKNGKEKYWFYISDKIKNQDK